MAEPKKTAARKKPASKGKAAAAAAKPTKRPAAGRPEVYTPAIAAQLCQYLMDGLSLRRACEKEGMPSRSTVFRWLHDNTGQEDGVGFWNQYVRAREVQAELWGEDTIEIADEDMANLRVVEWADSVGGARVPVMVAYDKTAVSRAKLRVDTRFKYAAQMAPKRFGQLAGNAGAEPGTGVVLFVKDLTGRKD
jgi:hypothetical protein